MHEALLLFLKVMVNGALGQFLAEMMVFVFDVVVGSLAVAVLQESEFRLRHEREAISNFEELVDVLLDLVERLQVEDSTVLACIDVGQDLTALALPLRLFVHALDVELITQTEHFAL